MIFTNKDNIPWPLAKAMSWQKQRYCDISVTELLKTPRELQLCRRHDADIEVDVSESLWAFFGTAMHKVLESMAKGSDVLSEEKLFIEELGWKIGGSPDWYYKAQDGKMVLADLKTTSVWSFIFEPAGKSDFHKQTNIYAEMLRRHGFPVDRIEIWGIARDYKASERMKNPDYPKSAITVIEIPVRQAETVTALIRGRVALHQDACAIPDDKLSVCTPEERWRKPTVYAIMKKGAAKSSKNFDNAEEARQYAKDMKDVTIQERIGQDTKCDSYCNAAAFCSYQKEKLAGFVNA